MGDEEQGFLRSSHGFAQFLLLITKGIWVVLFLRLPW